MWFRKKVSEPVSEKFGTEKSTGIGIENIWYRKKVSVSVSFNILGTVTHCSEDSDNHNDPKDPNDPDTGMWTNHFSLSFLSDPGLPGVRSMGLSVSNSNWRCL